MPMNRAGLRMRGNAVAAKPLDNKARRVYNGYARVKRSAGRGNPRQPARGEPLHWAVCDHCFSCWAVAIGHRPAN